MNLEELKTLYDLSGRTAVVTGGAGVLASEIVRTLAAFNANVVVLGRNAETAQKLVAEISAANESIYRLKK